MAALARTNLAENAARGDNASSAERRATRDIPALDGLRGAAVLLVIWCHVSGLTFTPSTDWLLEIKAASGFIGLYLFFVLSGFLLFLPYAQAFIAHTAWPNARRFYGRRMLRILPVYYAALLVPLAVALLRPKWGIVPPIPNTRSLLALFTLLHNIVPSAWSYLLGTNTPLWSLTVEWEFYLILPLLALGLRLLARRFGAPGVLYGLLGLMAYGLIVRAIAAATFYQHGYPTVMQVPGPLGLILTLLFGINGNYLELFALGMLASLIYAAATTPGAVSTALAWAKNTARVTRILAILTAASLLIGLPLYVIFLHVTGLIPTPAGAFVGRWPQDAPSAWTWSVFGPWLLAVILTVLLLGAILGPTWFRRPWAWRPLRLAGLISYSLYVWHALLQRFWVFFLAQNWPGVPVVLDVVPYLLILLLVGILSYRFIERPFLQLRKGRPLPIVAAFKRLTARRGQPDLPAPVPTSPSANT